MFLFFTEKPEPEPVTMETGKTFVRKAPNPPLRSPATVVIEPTDEGKCRDPLDFDPLVGKM